MNTQDRITLYMVGTDTEPLDCDDLLTALSRVHSRPVTDSAHMACVYAREARDKVPNHDGVRVTAFTITRRDATNPVLCDDCSCNYEECSQEMRRDIELALYPAFESKLR